MRNLHKVARCSVHFVNARIRLVFVSNYSQLSIKDAQRSLHFIAILKHSKKESLKQKKFCRTCAGQIPTRPLQCCECLKNLPKEFETRQKVDNWKCFKTLLDKNYTTAKMNTLVFRYRRPDIPDRPGNFMAKLK